MALSKEVAYSKEELRKYCQEIFNVPTFTFDGALSSVKGELTKTEAKEKITAWLKKEAK